MIFLSGIHCVGKSHFCNMILEQLGIKSYSASTLITYKRGRGFSPNKFVSDIDDNQPLLIEAVDELRRKEKEFILDGHFCLLNGNGDITRIPQSTYTSLNPDAIILLTEKPDVIARRRFQRDGIRQDICEIIAFQDAECQYADEVATILHVPIEISKGSEDLDRIIKFIHMRGE